MMPFICPDIEIRTRGFFAVFSSLSLIWTNRMIIAIMRDVPNLAYINDETRWERRFPTWNVLLCGRWGIAINANRVRIYVRTLIALGNSYVLLFTYVRLNQVFFLLPPEIIFPGPSNLQLFFLPFLPPEIPRRRIFSSSFLPFPMRASPCLALRLAGQEFFGF